MPSTRGRRRQLTAPQGARKGLGRLALAMLMTTGLAGGCGMNEYHERLKEEHARVKTLEIERQLLAEPLQMPPAAKKNEADDAPKLPLMTEAGMYLRPPKAFQCNKTPVLVSSGKGVDLYGYQGVEGKHVFAAAAPADMDQAEFQKAVWAAFQDVLKYRRVTQFPAEPKLKKQEDRIPPKTGREMPPPLHYDIWVWDEPETAPAPNPGVEKPPAAEVLPARFYLCFTRQPTIRVAVIYQLPARMDEALMQKALELSERSLATGPEAAKRIQAANAR